MKSRARHILDKSVSAMLAAIEIYNKPSFSYREESFSILAINAWELLLKARILLLESNSINKIIEYERHHNADGGLSKLLYKKKNRSGNFVTIGLFKAFDKLINECQDSIDIVVRKNLEALVEIRDNAVHFLNKDLDFEKKVYELGSASLKNYLNLARLWFGVTLNEYRIFLMPIAFLREIPPITAVSLNTEERNLLQYVRNLEANLNDDTERDFNFSLDIDIKLKRVSDNSALDVKISSDPDALPITLKEEAIRDQYPWDYANLTKRLNRRYSNFGCNQKYHEMRKKLEEKEKFCNVRYLDPGNSKSAKKKFYNPNILKEFDKKYTRSKAP